MSSFSSPKKLTPSRTSSKLDNDIASWPDFSTPITTDPPTPKEESEKLSAVEAQAMASTFAAAAVEGAIEQLQKQEAEAESAANAREEAVRNAATLKAWQERELKVAVPSMLSRGLVLPAAVLVGLIASAAYAVPHVQAVLAPAPPPEPTLFEWLFGEWY